MIMAWFDWLSVILFFLISLFIGILAARRSGRSAGEFFATGRSMPWWLLGISMVATTFSSDTPNLVSNMVRQYGVSGNWLWWAFLLTGMVTVFVYARLWRRSGVLTDIEFYELRYSGRSAAFLRGFRAVYLGVFFNVMIMAAVTLAAIKIGGVILNLSPPAVVLSAGTVAVIYSVLGGLRGVLLTDLLQFFVAMGGSVAAAVVALGHPRVGSIKNLFASLPEKTSLLPDFSDPALLAGLFIVPLAVQWWSVWYPGAEPGGGGYIAQRMLAARNEEHAVGATLLFNIAHYALRPWPWILVALASLLVFPELSDLQAAFPGVDPRIISHDLAYPAMLTFLPAGLLGLVVASLAAAYMSTISTHLNWGASYVVNDFYRRFINPEAPEKKLVLIGRLTSLGLMLLAGTLALALENALQAFQILLQVGAGTGLIFLLRWFWWRISATSEIAAMLISFMVAVYFRFAHVRLLNLPRLADWQELVIGVSLTTAGWLAVTFLTRPTERSVLEEFAEKLEVGGPGWRAVLGERADRPGRWQVPNQLLMASLGVAMVYGVLLGAGLLFQGHTVRSGLAGLVSLAAAVGLLLLYRRGRTAVAQKKNGSIKP